MSGTRPQASGSILDLGYLVCLDTYCFGMGYLTALNLANNDVFQVDKRGFPRRVPGEALWNGLSRLGKSLSGLFSKSGSNADSTLETTENAASCENKTDP